MRFQVWAIGMTVLLAASVARAEEDIQAQANNPLANITALNFQNLYTGSLSGLDVATNQFMVRYAQPFSAFGGRWVMRATMPVSTVPGDAANPFASGYTIGLGDFNAFAAYLFDTGHPGISFGLGPQITAPTASHDLSGRQKWSAGFANVLFNASSSRIQWGYLLTWQASFAGKSGAADVNMGAFQPFVIYQLGKGWYLRSSGIWIYNFENNGYTMPVGFGLGKVIKTQAAIINVFFEPQYAVATRGIGQQEWNLFGGVNFQF